MKMSEHEEQYDDGDDGDDDDCGGGDDGDDDGDGDGDDVDDKNNDFDSCVFPSKLVSVGLPTRNPGTTPTARTSKRVTLKETMSTFVRAAGHSRMLVIRSGI